jgi:hypothetical protein
MCLYMFLCEETKLRINTKAEVYLKIKIYDTYRDLMVNP